MKDADRFKLLHGPYRPPRTHRGAKLFCEIRGGVTVGGYSDGLIPWPRVKKGGNHCLILCGRLVDAVRQESEVAVAHWFGVSVTTVWKWRQVLAVEAYSPGTKALQGRFAEARDDGHMQAIQAKSRTPEAIEKRAAKQRGKPLILTPEQRKRQKEGARRSHTKEWGRKVSAALKASGHRPPVNEWTAEEDAELHGFDSNATIAQRLGRPVGGVQMRRVTLKIPAILPLNAHAIIQRRAALGWTRAQLAQRAKLSPGTVGRFESGRYRGAAREVIARIAGALGCDASKVVAGRRS